MPKSRCFITLAVLLISMTLLFTHSTTTHATGIVPSLMLLAENLLANPGFEGIGLTIDNDQPNYDNWTRDTYTGIEYGEIFTPEGWVTWWEEGEFKCPECKVIPDEAPFDGSIPNTPDRIYQGYYSAMCFSFYGKIHAGHYQVISGLNPGATVQAEYMAHAWSCNEDNNDAHSCGDPYGFSFRVGIDPKGGTDPFADTILWSEPYYIYDVYDKVGPVTAKVGTSGKVTMFTEAYGKWAVKHNDAYLDNPSLIIYLHKIYIPISKWSQ